MNLKNLPSCVLLGALSVGVADADWITEWGGNQLGVDFLINQAESTILIRRGEGNVYKFYSETFEGSGVPGVIENITVDAEAMGDFSILIDHRLGGDVIQGGTSVSRWDYFRFGVVPEPATWLGALAGLVFVISHQRTGRSKS